MTRKLGLKWLFWRLYEANMSRMARRPLASLIRAVASGPKTHRAIQSRAMSSSGAAAADDDGVEFGFLFDIDGVIVRGRQVYNNLMLPKNQRDMIYSISISEISR